MMTPAEVERDKQVWYIVWKMKKTLPESRKETFEMLVVGMEDPKQVKRDVWARMQN